MKYSARVMLRKQKTVGRILLAVFTIGLLLSIVWKEDCTPFVLFMTLSAKVGFSNKLLF